MGIYKHKQKPRLFFGMTTVTPGKSNSQDITMARLSTLSLFSQLLLTAVSAISTPDHGQNATYDYIVVGSGPGGAPVAAQLAKHGYSVLLMDAGDDQRANFNTSISVVLSDVAAEDEKLRWDYFVRYHADDNVVASYRYLTWETPEGNQYVGQSPPPGSKALGVYYPRSGTLGGCSAHNAGGAIIPQDSYWNDIAKLTGDKSWGYVMTSLCTQKQTCSHKRLQTREHEALLRPV